MCLGLVRETAGATTVMGSRPIQLKLGVGCTDGKDNLVGEKARKMMVKIVDIGKHKKDGKRQSQAANGEAVFTVD